MALPESPRAVVTGAGSGLGRALCVVLAQRGARIVASDINLSAARATVALLPGDQAHAVACDVANFEQVQALGEKADQLLGGVDLVVNNAGVAAGGRVGEIPLSDWQWLLGINLWGVIHGCHVFVPRLRRQKSGHILNVASAAGLAGLPQLGPYNVSKAGVIALSETLHGELLPEGISVTVLCPTFFQTGIARTARAQDPRTLALAEKLMELAPLTAEDVARRALQGVDRGELYVLPQADARWIWRLKRLAPDRFHLLAPRLLERQARRLGIEFPR
ncbi:MAG TPA: SDR family NAD(P)-dependent oxidoreductase [Polyangia bacterium]|nr:SDR family NAD(P)-dependent oxidoreductase [Polyangia bacterium]